MSRRIIVLPGDGIGPEVVPPAVEVVQAVTGEFEFEEHLFGGASIKAHGTPLTDETLEACRQSEAVLLGAAGGLQWDRSKDEGAPKPERGLLSLRKELGLYANLRPISSHPALYEASPLKSRRLQGVDILFVRELSGGIYNQETAYTDGDDEATDVCRYTRDQIERIAHTAFGLAKTKVTSIDKANVMATSKLWRKIVNEVAQDYDVELEHLLVDNAAAQLMKRPRDFEVVVTENLFGDILSDESTVIPGSLGMLPSASLAGEGKPGLFEPGAGSAPDIAGKGIANPHGTILSGAMMLRHLGKEREAIAIETAVTKTLKERRFRTPDIGGKASTREATDAVLAQL